LKYFKDTDSQELNALAGVFCTHKKTPQLIGSITGNIGNTESCAGLVAIVKVIMAMEHGVIPPTVNYHTPNPAVPALLSGKLKVRQILKT
jgi:fatty acid synthase